MKNKITLAVLAVSLLVPGLAYANVNTTLYIQGSGGSILVDTLLVVEESCTVQDSAGTTHTFSGHKAICALEAAENEGIIASFQVTDAGFGFSLDSINGIANAQDWSELWQLWRNGVSSSVGIQDLVLVEGDAFQLTYGPWLTAIVQPVSPERAGGGPVIVDVFPRKMDVENAVSFLVAQQREDGSFGLSLLTDWTAVALGSYEGKSASAFYAVNALKEWLTQNPITESSTLTDYERRAMALMSLGVDPYFGTNTNYIEAILQEFDGEQFGSQDLVNDDIFSALVLLKAGYEANMTPLLETLPFILSWQRESGSFGSIDLTAAAIQVLTLFSESGERNTALQNAKEYLESKQESDGGFGNVYSTSWALQAIAALNEDGDAWAMDVDKRTPEHFLALRQAFDGGLLKEDSKENRIWATAYAVLAALQKSWGDVLKDFKRSTLVTLVPQNEEALAQHELDALQAQIALLTKEIARTQAQILTALQLKRIEREVSRIVKEVEELQPNIASLHVAPLTQLEIPQDPRLAQEQQADKLSQFNFLEAGALSLAEESAPKGEQDRMSAAAAATAKNFFVSGTGQALLVFGAGIALFLVLGGWRVVLSLVRRERAPIWNSQI